VDNGAVQAVRRGAACAQQRPCFTAAHLLGSRLTSPQALTAGLPGKRCQWRTICNAAHDAILGAKRGRVVYALQAAQPVTDSLPQRCYSL